MIVALHGFLGKPSDWDCILPSKAVKVDLFAPHFQIPEGNVLIGYSLGGRLALQYLRKQNFRAAVIISTHPGFENKEEKKERIEQDERWAYRFENENWDDLMLHWNAQGVFCGHQMPREEKDFDRKQLAFALREWSLGRQNLIRVEQFSIPILWVTGERDTKFTEIAKTLSFKHKQSKHIIIPSAGHRVPWENRNYFKTKLNQFLGELS